MPERLSVLSAEAAEDIREILLWSSVVEQVKFGIRAASRYQALLRQALRDVAADPNRPGSQDRRELAKGTRSYHLHFSRLRARTATGIVQNPRHFLIYRCHGTETVEILRILHDSRDLSLHLL